MKIPNQVHVFNQDTPLGRAFFALNYYISTGDHIGEGVGAEEGDSTLLMIAYRPREWEDKDNSIRLRARLSELKSEGFPLSVQDGGGDGEFSFFTIQVPTPMLDDFARKIKEKPGPKGWGSMYTFLERNGLLEKNER